MLTSQTHLDLVWTEMFKDRGNPSIQTYLTESYRQSDLDSDLIRTLYSRTNFKNQQKVRFQIHIPNHKS